MKKLAASLLVMLYPVCASAQIFKVDISVDTSGVVENKKLDFDIARDFFDNVSNAGFQRLFPNYNNNSIVTTNNTYNGIAINISFPERGSTKLVFEVPELGIRETFNERTRGRSTTALEHYLRNDVQGTTSKIIRHQIANTATSQLAGNPTSLQGQLVSNNFNVATRPTTGGLGAAQGRIANQFAVGVGGGSYSQNGTDVNIINVPITQEINVDSDNPNRKILLNGQFNYVTIGEAASFQGGLGIGYEHPVTDSWSLIPSVSYGVIGSVDLYALGQILSTAIASNYRLDIGDYRFSTVNMYGHYQSLPLNVSGITSDPNISNHVLKNGFFLDRILPFPVLGHRLNVRGIFTDTQFFGTEVFVRQYNEVGLQINTADQLAWLDAVSFGLADTLNFSAKYVFSIENPDSFEGYEIGLGYNF